MKTLAITEAQHEQITRELRVAPDRETVLLASGTVSRRVGEGRFVVKDVLVPHDAAYARRDAVSAELRPEYLGPTVRGLRGSNAFVGFIHSHPGSVKPFFSPEDDRGEQALAPFLDRQFGSPYHVSMIAGSDVWAAREVGTTSRVRVIRVGRHLTELTSVESLALEHSHDRQVRVFGPDGQAALQRVRFAIVGVGGTGGVVAQSLAYLGARHIRLIDFDTVDATNLNRLIGASAKDVGRLKVEVTADHVRSISPQCEVHSVADDITSGDVALELLNDDVVFCCTDSHGSRVVLNQFAYQYYFPCFDTGVSIHVLNGSVRRITGRAQMLSPGLGCLTCGNLLDPDEVRRDLMTPAQRRGDPYFVGQRVPQPAVISINSTAASLSLTMALGAICRFPVSPRMQVYDAISGSVRSVEISPVPDCVVCSSRGAFGQGSSWELPTRRS